MTSLIYSSCCRYINWAANICASTNEHSWLRFQRKENDAVPLGGRSVPCPELPHPKSEALQKAAPLLSLGPDTTLTIRNEVHKTG